MRKTLATGALLAFVLAGWTAGFAAVPAMADDKQALMAEGKTLIRDFGGALKAELQAALQEGGPVKAIEICQLRAPAIARGISEDSGWRVARSSHRLRNPNNTPDAYTAAAIEEFLTRQAAGEAAADLVKAEIVTEQGSRVFRMVKAIPTGALCLNCHGGSEVKPEVVAALAERYPDDRARGFGEGDMRGVFSLKKPLE